MTKALSKGIGPLRGARRAAAAMAALALLQSCLAPGSDLSEPPLRARALFALAERDLAEGLRGPAESSLREAVSLYPGFLEAHRALQDLMEAEARGHEAFEEYRALFSSGPVVPENLILYGRLVADPGLQAELFAQARQMDPTGYWPNLCWGYSLYYERDFSGAAHHFRKAAAARGADPLAWRFLAEALQRSRDFKGSLAALRKAALCSPRDRSVALRAARILRLLGREEEAYGALLDLLRDGGGDALLCQEIRRLLEDSPAECPLSEAVEAAAVASSKFPQNPETLAFSGWLRLLSGDFEAAASSLAKASERGAPFPETPRDLRRALFALRRYSEGLAAWKSGTPLPLSGLADNDGAPLYEALEKAVEKASGKEAGPAEQAALGAALLDIGWIEEGLGVLAQAAAAGFKEAGPLLARGRGFLNVVAALKEELHRGYVDFTADGEPLSLEAFLEAAGPAVAESAGEDLCSGNKLKTFAFVGSMLSDEDGAESPLLRYFRSFNHRFVLGRKAGGPPEAVLMNVVFGSKDGKHDHLGAEVTCDMVAGENFRIRSFGEYLGGGLFGLALTGFFYVNLDEVVEDAVRTASAVREARALSKSLSAFGSWKARSQEEALWLDAGFGLKEKLLAAAFEGVQDSELNSTAAQHLYQGVIDHELMHVRDADRYLPVTSHPIAALGLALNRGLSAASIEAHMERRAALAALAASWKPELELASLLRHAPYPEASLPHSRGYCALLRSFLEEILEDENRPQELDPGRNLCRQLCRADRAYFSKIALRMALSEGIARGK